MIRKKIKEYQERYKKALSKQDRECTLWFEGAWSHCCKEHDNGCARAASVRSEVIRKHEDKRLRDCANRALPMMGSVMYAGIRTYLNTRKIFFGTPKY